MANNNNNNNGGAQSQINSLILMDYLKNIQKVPTTPEMKPMLSLGERAGNWLDSPYEGNQFPYVVDPITNPGQEGSVTKGGEMGSILFQLMLMGLIGGGVAGAKKASSSEYNRGY